MAPQNLHLLRNNITQDQEEMLSKPEALSTDDLSYIEELDRMAKTVSEAIHSNNVLYSEIGYSAQEKAEKIAEIFQGLNSKIESSKSSLQREINCIKNECDWLRQQVRVILAVINDSEGLRTLNLSSREIVFHDTDISLEGWSQEMRSQADSFRPSDSDESSGSPDLLFSNRIDGSPPRHMGSRTSSGPESLRSFTPKTSEPSSDGQVPRLSLRQSKSKLNWIFLEVMKAFVAVYRKFNEKNLQFWSNVAIYTEDWVPEDNVDFLKSIPSATDAKHHFKLIQEFDRVCSSLDPKYRGYNSGRGHHDSEATEEQVAFVVPSPRKQQGATIHLQNSVSGPETDAAISRLREINHELVNAIRSLKLTKFTDYIIEQLTIEVDKSKEEINRRVQVMKDSMSRCWELVCVLSLSESEFASVQQGLVQTENPSSGAYFELDEFHHVMQDPRAFGVMDLNLHFVSSLEQTLQTIKDTKQKERDGYADRCAVLWEKLGENDNYIDNFLSENSQLTETTLKNFRFELQRLYLKRSEYVDKLISKAQTKICELQKTLLYSDAECAKFRYSAGDKEQILDAHEAEIERLETEISQRQPILSLFAQLNELVENQKFLLESMKDPSRFHSKNSFRIISYEEKLRKKIDKNWPRTLAALKQEICAFNDQQRALGLPSMTAGNEDMLQHVVHIESEMTAHGVKQPVRRSVSPAKAPTATKTKTTAVSPKKGNSPMRVAKTPVQRRSPVSVNSSQQSGRGPSPRIVHPNVKLAHLQTTDTFTGIPRPSARISPTSKVNASVDRTKPGKPVLVPLKTSLAPADRQFGGPLPGISSSPVDTTHHSTCTRVSPLRSGSSANVAMSSLSPVKSVLSDIHFDELDKENSFADASSM